MKFRMKVAMNIPVKLLSICALLAPLALGAVVPVSTSAADDVPIVWTAAIRGTINPASSSYFQNAISSAEKDQAQALVVELDTPGGLLSSVREMTQAIDKAQIPIVVYVTPAGASATSAGAILMLGSHVAAMAPGTNIGAAHPVGPQGEDIQGAGGEKATNDTAAFARGLAELRNRNRDLAEQIVSKSKSFTAEEALKNRLIEIVAPSKEELFRSLHAREVQIGQNRRVLKIEKATIKSATMTTGQEVLNFLANPNVAGLLITIGIMLLYFELSAPGISIPGILGAICLLVAFMSFQLLPIRTGGLILLLAGVAMMIAEPFVISHGVLALGGVACFVLGLIWVVDPSSTSLSISPLVWISAGLTLGFGVFVIGIAAARMRKMSKATLKKIGGSGVAGLAGYSGTVESVDESGVHGKAHFRGEIWDFQSDAPLKNGDAVEAVRVEGMRIIVKKA